MSAGKRRRRGRDGRSSGRRPRDRDVAASARWLKLVAWGGLPGALIGFLIGLFGGGGILWGVLGAVVCGGGAVAFGAGLAEGAGRMAETLYNPSGASTPYRTDYSHAETLAARGRYDEAIEAYESAVAENPGEPEPYIRIARLLRDELGRFEAAARWFRRVRRDARTSDRQEVLVGRELVELYRDRMDLPFKAAPELARLAERLGDGPEGEWARRELAELKERLAGKDRMAEEEG